MSEDIKLTSAITVRLVQKMGGDAMVVAPAKASTSGEDALRYADPEHAEANAGLINYLMVHRHGVPFEHSAMTFFVHAPAMVWWEWIRHRIGQTVDCESEFSFSLESGRYKQLEPVLWIPSPTRKLIPAEGHKSARPKFEVANDLIYKRTVEVLSQGYRENWKTYQILLANKIANEVCRSVLGFGIYYSGWVTVNPRSLMAFLSLRTHNPEAKFVSYPQAEIEEAARACEQVFADGWPITYRAFVKNGRVAP